MSKLFLTLFVIAVLSVVLTEAWPRRGRGHRGDFLGRYLGRDLSSDIGRGFRRWMRRNNGDESDVNDEETGIEDVPDSDDSDDDSGSDENMPPNRRGRWRHRFHRRGERCRGCRHRQNNRQNIDNEEGISDIIGTNGRNRPTLNQPVPDLSAPGFEEHAQPGRDLPGRHRNRWNSRQGGRRMGPNWSRRRNGNGLPWQRRRSRWQQRRINRHRQRNDRRSRHRFNFGFGHRGNRYFNFDFDFNFGGRKPWWEGPNVCYSSTTGDNRTADISPHSGVYAKKCDDTGTAYKCVTTVIKMLTEETTTETRECCTGYTRKPEDYGCPIELNLKNLVDTARDLELNQFIRAAESVRLLPELQRGNFTVFAPVDAAFEDLNDLIQTDTNVQLQDMGSVVVVSRPLTELLVSDLQNVLLGHLSFDTLTTSKLNDEQLVETGSPFKSKIRINFYGSSEKLMTANCKKVKSRDNVATNGVIHVVEGLLEPVTKSLLDIISKNPQLSYLKTAIGRSGLGQTFREDGQFTIFAPTDNAFRKIDQRVLNKLLDGEECLQKVLKNHVLPNVICSSVIQGRKSSSNLLHKHLKLERDANDKLFVEGVQIIDVDVMGTNGVLYLIDEVIVPDDALGVLDIAERENATKVLELIQTAGLEKTLREAENITLFVPTNKAFSELDASVLRVLQNDSRALQDVLKYHVSPSVQTCNEFYNDYELDTLNGDKKLRINEYSTFPFGRMWYRTVQCAPIAKASIKACNGVVHVIDKVLIPPKGTVIDTLELDSRFTKLVQLIKISGLADLIQRNKLYTIFAPTNAAFDKLDQEFLNELENDEEELMALLKGHVTEDILCCAGIFEDPFFGRSVRTLSRKRYSVGLEEDTPTIDGKEITDCDITASNGVVHAIDEVLVPERMRDEFGFGGDFWDDLGFDWDF